MGESEKGHRDETRGHAKGKMCFVVKFCPEKEEGFYSFLTPPVCMFNTVEQLLCHIKRRDKCGKSPLLGFGRDNRSL